MTQAKLLGTAGLKAVAAPKELVDSSIKTEFLSRDEWRRLGAIGVLFVFNILFWAIYEQGGSSLNIFANKCVDNRIFGWTFPSSWLQTFQAGFIVLFAPIISMIWLKLGDKQPTAPTKFAIGILLLGLGISLMVPASMLAAQGKVSPLWLIGVFLFECLGRIVPQPGWTQHCHQASSSEIWGTDDGRMVFEYFHWKLHRWKSKWDYSTKKIPAE